MTLRSILLGVTACLLAAAAQAEVVNFYHVTLNVSGSNTLNVQGGGPNKPAQTSGTRNEGSVTAVLGADVDRYASAKVELSGSGNADARVQASSSFNFHLQPPAGANVKGGKLVLHVLLEGTATGNADLHLVTSVQTDYGNASANASISDVATQRTEFDVSLTIAPFIEDLSKADGKVHFNLIATATLANGMPAAANATPNTKVTGFRVFNSTGAQVPGFSMVADGGNIPELSAVGPTPPVTGTKVTATEFYHAVFKHYFVSANPAEIGKLDDGTFAGWARTGQSFSVYSGTSYEGDVFYVPLPDAAGTCPAGTVAVYRLYNNGQGGAPNHRFTTSDATRQQMLAQGYVAEGAGIGVGFCSPL